MDLKLKDVAELLSVSETTIRRWLADGKIPAYRLNRQYRFSRTEIEDWLLGQKLETAFADEEEESKATTVESTPHGSLQFGLYRALYRGQVLPHVNGKSKEEVIHLTMDRMAERFNLDAAVLTELFLDREKMMPTTLGHGIGVPHTRDFLLDTHFDVIEVVYPEHPLEYGALDGEPVHTLFFLFACDDRHHLNLLAKLAHFCSNEKNRAFLRTQPSKERLLDCIKHWESSLHA